LSGPDEIERLARRVRDEPRSTVFVALAEALRRAGRHVEGLQVLREGFRHHPDHAPGRVVMARIHLDLGRRAVGMAVLEEVTRSDPANVAAGATLARLLVEEGRLTEAAALVDRLAGNGNTDGSVGEVIELLRVAHAAGPVRGPDPFDQPALADRMARRGHPRRALSVLRRVLAAHPDNLAIGTRVAELERTCAESPSPGRVAPVPRPRTAGPFARYVTALWERR